MHLLPPVPGLPGGLPVLLHSFVALLSCGFLSDVRQLLALARFLFVRSRWQGIASVLYLLGAIELSRWSTTGERSSKGWPDRELQLVSGKVNGGYKPGRIRKICKKG